MILPVGRSLRLVPFLLLTCACTAGEDDTTFEKNRLAFELNDLLHGRSDFTRDWLVAWAARRESLGERLTLIKFSIHGEERDGQVIETWRARRLTQSPRQPYTAEMAEEAGCPQIVGIVEDLPSVVTRRVDLVTPPTPQQITITADGSHYYVGMIGPGADGDKSRSEDLIHTQHGGFLEEWFEATERALAPCWRPMQPDPLP